MKFVTVTIFAVLLVLVVAKPQRPPRSDESGNRHRGSRPPRHGGSRPCKPTPTPNTNETTTITTEQATNSSTDAAIETTTVSSADNSTATTPSARMALLLNRQAELKQRISNLENLELLQENRVDILEDEMASTAAEIEDAEAAVDTALIELLKVKQQKQADRLLTAQTNLANLQTRLQNAEDALAKINEAIAKLSQLE